MKQNGLRSFYIYCNYYCPRRSLEASKLYRYFIENGLRSVSEPGKADLILIYTCGGFALNEEDSVLTIKKALQSGVAKVVIAGCLPKIDPEKLENFSNLLVVQSGKYEVLDSLLGSKVPYDLCPDVSKVEGIHDLYHGTLFSRIAKFYRRTRQYATFSLGSIRAGYNYVKLNLMHSYGNSIFSSSSYKIEIAQGCLGSCSYCAIKLAMPRFQSCPEDEVLEKFRTGLRAGYTDFVLCAGDIGCYGLDINTNLPSLLRKLFEVEGDYRLLLNDLNAVWLVKYYDEFLEILRGNSTRISRIVIPIQSGSDRILELMKRQYRIDEIARCIKGLVEAFPKLIVETHIIVGFPGETDSDFQKSVELVKGLRFSRVVLYPYDDRPNTPASVMPGKIPGRVVDQRMREISKYAFR